MIRSDILKEPQNKNKKRTAVWLYPETFEKMDLLLNEDNCNNRSAFIEKALTFYMGYLVSNQTTDYLSKILLGAIQGTLRETENRQSAISKSFSLVGRDEYDDEYSCRRT